MSLWQKIKHPCVWMTADDFPRLQENAQQPFWKQKLDRYRTELAAYDELTLLDSYESINLTGFSNFIFDFHKGDNMLALKAAMCHTVDQDDHTGRLIASFLKEIIRYYHSRSSLWREKMCGMHADHVVIGENWGGLSENHIKDPMLWFSCAHLYDVIYGKGYLDEDVAVEFETMMAQFHQLCVLHQEMRKMDNNRAAWLCGGSYLSSLFDEDDLRGQATRRRSVGFMPRLISTILDDGCHYEIGPYSEAAITAMHYAARIIRNVEGKDFFEHIEDGVSFKTAFEGWPHRLIPGSKLRLWTMKDRVNHWDTTCFGYLQYNVPELGWAINRMHEGPWVPMFRHWPQGAEFYSYRKPDNAREPQYKDSHLEHAGVSIMRSSWQADANSMYFRYGFQGSSHGGGLDKLNFELTCNDEPIICDPLISERSHDKNVVLVDNQDQEQCTGKCLYANMNHDDRLQVISAVSGLGDLPSREIFHDPATEIGYWCTRHPECFPGIARMRRTILFVDRRYWIIRDTMWSLDENEHQYQWLYHSFGKPVGMGPRLAVQEQTLRTKRLFHTHRPLPTVRRLEQHDLLNTGRLTFESPNAHAHLFFMGVDTPSPNQVNLWHGQGKHHFSGGPEIGDGMAMQHLHGVCFTATGKDLAMVTVIDAHPSSQNAYVQHVQTVNQDGIDKHVLQINTTNGIDVLTINESDHKAISQGQSCTPTYSIESSSTCDNQ